jgi:5-methylcytosine-specific restriction endonuclease McrA
MKNHTEVFRNFWWDELTLGQNEQCFMNGEDDDCRNFEGTNVHHIKKRQSGGNKNLDYIENLASLCSSCHSKADQKPGHQEFNKRVRIKTLRMIADKLESELR